MNRSRWLTAGVSVIGAIGVGWGLNWFSEQLMPVNYPGKLAYKPVEEMPPRADLGSIQRDWPNSLDKPGEKNRMLAYQHEIEGKVAPPDAEPRAVTTPEAPPDLGSLLANADPATGKQKAQACLSCHDFSQGGPDRIGPNLWGVVGRDVASRPSFSYSKAMSAHPGIWSYSKLFDYLASPARAIPGNRMGFAGMRSPQDRAAVISYLATLTSNPPPFPSPQAPDQGTHAQ